MFIPPQHCRYIDNQNICSALMQKLMHFHLGHLYGHQLMKQECLHLKTFWLKDTTRIPSLGFSYLFNSCPTVQSSFQKPACIIAEKLKHTSMCFFSDAYMNTSYLSLKIIYTFENNISIYVYSIKIWKTLIMPLFFVIKEKKYNFCKLLILLFSLLPKSINTKFYANLWYYDIKHEAWLFEYLQHCEWYWSEFYWISYIFY